MATLITKNSSTASAVPAAGDLVKGELAVNVTDKKVYTKDNSAAVVKLVGSLGNQEANAVAVTGGTINGTTIGATTPSTGAFTTASASSGFTGNLTGNVTGNVSGTAANVTGVVAIANGGTGLSALGTGVQSALGQAVTGSGSFVLSTSPSLTTPNLGTPSAAVLTNATGLPLTTGVTGTLGVANGGTGITAFGTGVATALGQNVTGSGGIVLATSPSLTTPNLGTPSAATLTNATGLPISTGVSGLGTGVATALAVNTGSSGAFVVNGGALGTPSSGTLTNATGLPLSTGVTGTLAVANGGTGQTTANAAFNALAPSQTGNSGKYLTTDGTNTSWATNPLGTVTSVAMTVPSFLSVSGSPITSSGTLAVSLSGTALPTANGGTGLTSFTANGVVYASSTSALTTGSALTFDGTNLTVPAEVYRTSDTSYLRLSGGNGPGTGANVLAFGTTHATAPGRLSLTATGTGQIQSYSAGGDHVWSIVSEQMRLTSTGLGIGTSSPAAKLELLQTSTTDSSLRLRYNSSSIYGNHLMNGGGDYVIEAPASNGVTSGNFRLRAGSNFSVSINNNAATSPQLLLDSSGNLGLGVTPSASWDSIFKAIQIGSASYLSIAAQTTATARGSILWNAVGSGDESFVYRNTGDPANRFMVGSGFYAWYTAPSGTAGNAISFTQSMTLDASGNLGVGTTSPGERLHVYSTSATGAMKIQSTQNYSVAYFTSAINTSGVFFGTDGAGNAYIENKDTAKNFNFVIGGSERARITSGGYSKFSTNGTYVSTIGPYHELRKAENNADWAVFIEHAGATATNQFGTRINLTGDPNTASNEFLYCSGATTLRASIRSNGGIANYQANDVNLSDRREKTNFAPAKSYLDTICAIPVQTFNYIDQSEDDPGLTLGVVAQDVQAVAPELVHESDWGTEEEPKMRLSIYQTDLQYALMKCIQELKAQNDDLRARLAAAGI